MAPRHLLLLVTVCALWGLNSIAAAVALQFLSPLWLTLCRSGVLATPAVASVRLPRRYWLAAAIYGIGTFGIQFPLYYEALRAGVPAGVSSVIAQTGVIWSLVPIFGVTAATLLLDEQWTPRMVLALVIIVTGLATVQLLPNLLANLRRPPR